MTPCLSTSSSSSSLLWGLARAGLAVLLTAAPILAQTTFAPAKTVLSDPFIQPEWEVHMADLDGDGDLDLLALTNEGARIVWQPNLGGGQFGIPLVIAAPVTESFAYWIRAVDLDGDGDVDVLSVKPGQIAWLENLGSGSFTPKQVLVSENPDISDWNLACATDLDGDGDLDLLIAEFQGKASWFENQGGLTFAPGQAISQGVEEIDGLEALDLDGDGDVDVFAFDFVGGLVGWYENLGGANFSPWQEITSEIPEVWASSPADVDGDGDADVLVFSGSTDTLSWLENLGGMVFGPPQAISTVSSYVSFVRATDLDHDGDLDVLYGDFFDDNPVTAWHENLGSGAFGTQQVLSANAMSAPCVADVDGDGDNDVLLVEEDLSSWPPVVVWYENLAVPPAPQQLLATTCWSVNAWPAGEGQSFTADASGNVTAIGMRLQLAQPPVGALILSLYEGAGFHGQELYSQVVSTPHDVGTVTPMVDIVLATAVPVVSGQVYTIGVMSNTEGGFGGFCGTTTDVYGGGSLFVLGTSGAYPSADAAFTVTISPDEPTAWSNEGYALAGFAGDPVLVGSGTLAGGSSNAVVLSHAAPSALAAFFQSTVGTAVPFKGGILKAFPFFDPPVLVTTPDGTLPIPFVMPPGFPAGIEIWDQWAIKDPAAPNGVALSNSVRGLFP